MTEKRFEYYEHKGADYILDTPNKSLDFIEMLGDCLEAEEIVDLLNEQNETITEQASQIDFLKDENIHMRNVLSENKELKQQRDFYYARLQKIIKVANGDV